MFSASAFAGPGKRGSANTGNRVGAQNVELTDVSATALFWSSNPLG